jgi:TolB-like protein/class 3 adenylate cyclase/Flp pilus assembly protein TadD
MSSEIKKEIQLEIAHVLFIDIVGYSKLSINDQRAAIDELTQAVRTSEQFQNAEAAARLIKIPTGDGMALVFYQSPEEPVKCALEISRALKEHSRLQLRMGVHSGPVSGVIDVNDHANLAGAGLNMAQRVMACGDAGHILLSRHVAEDLEGYEQWRPLLHDLGFCEVKHGVKLQVVNLCTDEAGNRALPGKLLAQRQGVARTRWILLAASLVLLAAVVAAFVTVSRRAARSSSAIPEKSIAVLPLENLSEEKENAFFADGIQDDVLTSLTKISDLKVISRTSVMQYRGTGAARNLREIAQALGVANILEGSVRRAGNRVLISVQLIDARNDRHIWAERYDRTIADSIGLQGELATEIAVALRAKLAPEEKVRLATKPTTNPEAYVLYLQATERGRTAASKEDAFATDDLYAKAIELDPAFALAIARRSMWNSLMYNVGRRPENKARASALAAQALQLSPDLSEAHVASGLCSYWTEKDYAAALKEFSIAATTSANDPEVLDYTASIYCRQGRWREGLANYDRAQELDPRKVHYRGPRARVTLRDWPAAVAGYQRLLAINPNDVYATTELASVKISQSGDFAAARKLLGDIQPGLHGAAVGQPSMIDVSLTQARWELNMLARDYAGAEKVLVDYKGEEFLDPMVGMKTFDAARLALARSDVKSAKSLFEKVRLIYETDARDHPDDARFHAPLGLLYAYLGRKNDAIRESRRAVELCPETKDAVEGPGYAGNLALVYARTGEVDQAVTLIERLLTTPAGVIFTELRLSWEWDPLRTNARFQKIVTGPEPKTIY